MRCPFLREAQVKFCRASAFRKMIVRVPGQTSPERCCTPGYVTCPVSKQHHEERPSLDHCPFLHESLVQYCSAGPVTKFIPYSESVLSRCGMESHKYCESYLGFAKTAVDGEEEPDSAHDQCSELFSDESTVDGMHIPASLWFAPNHMWLDVSADGLLHVGIDALVARVFGALDSVTFLTRQGVHRPTVVLCLNGVDIPLAFPNPMLITKTNSYLRSTPSKILTNPYTLGWLFEGVEAKEPCYPNVPPVTADLIPAKSAKAWMENELKRANSIAQRLNSLHQQAGPALMADGGGIQPGLAQQLNREEMLQFFNEFCAQPQSRRIKQ
jgi:glycine cleavage system H lipoate-binding protein